MKAVTKREKKQILSILLGIAGYSLLESPISNLISKLGFGDLGLIIFGILFIIGTYYIIDY